jgi:superfamily II DNA/RNA helicase
MKSLPKTCQGFLMSATLSPELNKLKGVVLHSPAVLKLEEDEDVRGAAGVDGQLMQYYLDLPGKDKFLVLYVFLKVRFVVVVVGCDIVPSCLKHDFTSSSLFNNHNRSSGYLKAKASFSSTP